MCRSCWMLLHGFKMNKINTYARMAKEYNTLTPNIGIKRDFSHKSYHNIGYYDTEKLFSSIEGIKDDVGT